MKNTFLIFCCIVFLNTVHAQDTIIKFDNNIILAKISEINSSEIKYKRYSFQDGPTYIELKSNVRMIVYANGVKEIIKAGPNPENNKLSLSVSDDYINPAILNPKIQIEGNRYLLKGNMHSERKIQRLLLDTKDKQIAGYVTKAKRAQKLQYVGFGAIPLGIAGLLLMESAVTTGYSNTGQYSPKTNYNLATFGAFCIAGAIACPIASGVFKHKRKQYNTEAVNLYNEKY